MPGLGITVGALDPTSTLITDAAVDDAITVTNHMRDRFGQDKIYLLGNSWGTIVGVLAAQQHPELFRAFIGAGQMVSIRETDRIFYTDTLTWARSTGQTGLVPQDIDFRVDVPRLEVPVYLVQGRYEARGRAELAEQWFTALSAPSKQLVVLETSGHRPLFEQPEQFATVMTETVLTQTRTGDSP